MSRGEYGPPFGDEAGPSQGRHAIYDRVNELDAAIQQADHDFATHAGGQSFDPAEFVHRYWQPFLHAWTAARPALLAGKIDRSRVDDLASWIARYNELWSSATGSWGFRTSAPIVFFRGGDMIGAELPSDKKPWWKKAAGIGAVLGVGYLVLVRPRQKAGDRRLAEAHQLAADVGLHYGMTEEEKDRAFDAYYKRKGYPSYLMSTAPKFTR